MKSIKPGRGPSMLNGYMGITMILFGIIWTIAAAGMSSLMAVFGILWTVVAVGTTIYHFKNATAKNRYSAFDITENTEESDPLNDRFGSAQGSLNSARQEGSFCPYCGNTVQGDFAFCNRCGKRLPKH